MSLRPVDDLINSISTSSHTRHVESLITSGRVDVNARFTTRDAKRCTPLILAAELGHTEIVALLLNLGAHVNDRDNYGQTACHQAASHNHAATLQVLVDRGANVNQRDQYRNSVLQLALGHVGDGCLMVLLKCPRLVFDDADILCRAAAKSVRAIQALQDRQVNVALLRILNGGTACHVAANKQTNDPDSFRVLGALLDLFGDELMNVRDHGGMRCIHLAAESGAVESLRLLIQRGADIDDEEAHGHTPFEVNLWRRKDDESQLQCAIVLLAAGATIDTADAWLTTGRVDRRIPHAVATIFDDIPDFQADPVEVEAMRARIGTSQLDFVRARALQVCIGLQPLKLDALQTEELFDFGNLIRSSAADPGDATLMRAFEQLRSENADALLTMCNMFHGTPLDMAVDWKRDALVDALVPLYVAAIDVSIDDDDDDLEEYHHASGRDYDSDPACHLLDALRSAAELGRVDSVRAIVAALESANVTLARLERRAPPGSEPVLVNAVRGFDRSHEYPELLTDCADHGPYDSCEFDAATQRSRPPSEHSPATSLAIVELLVRGGVDLHAANEMERMCTGFCAALEVGELAIARALLAHDAAVAHTARMHEGRGALQAAIDSNSLECVRFVVETCNVAATLADAGTGSAEIRAYLREQVHAGNAAPAAERPSTR